MIVDSHSIWKKRIKAKTIFFPDNANSMQKTPKEERHNLIQTKIQKIKRYVNKAGYTAISCGRVGRGGNATVRN